MSVSSSGVLAKVLPIGPVSAGALVWRNGAELQLTLVAQARFRMVHLGPMTVLEPLPLVQTDRYQDGAPLSRLLEGTDAVPFRPRVDVWMTGSARAAGGRPCQAMGVRMALYRAGQSLFDKGIHVFGNRANAEAVPEFFVELPLVYERAYGGPGSAANPVGCGLEGGAQLPNLIHPWRPGVAVGFAPVSSFWQARCRGLSMDQRRQVERAVPSIGAGFDWGFFQAAPDDQQLERLVGEEWLLLEGVHAELGRIESSLPGGQAFGRVLGGAGAVGETVALGLDTVRVCADTQEVRLTWRGLFGVGSPRELGALRVAAGMEEAPSGIDWGAVDARLRNAEPLERSFSPEVREALRRLDGEPYAVGATADGSEAAGDGAGALEAWVAGPPTLPGQGQASEFPFADVELYGETIKNIDVAALRRELRLNRTLQSGGVRAVETAAEAQDVARLEWTLSGEDGDTLATDGVLPGDVTKVDSDEG